MSFVPRPPNAVPAGKGRGVTARSAGRFDTTSSAVFDDGWGGLEEVLGERPVTTVEWETSRSIINDSDSPDMPARRSINPYRGCEHGCTYCFARPSHAFLNLSPGLDFETRLFAKRNAAQLLRQALAKPGYRPQPITLGINTDAYQPVERRLRVTRSLLEVLAECAHPVSLITKSTLIERDLDLLASMAAQNLAEATLSIPTLDEALSRRMEPRAAAPARRLKILEQLSAAGVPTGVLTAPVIPGLTDHELERILERAAAAGAVHAGYVMLRLPHELRELFPKWLHAHCPDRAARVLSLLRQVRGGDLYDARFGARMRGTGPYAQLVARRFELACRRLRLDRERPPLQSGRFRPPGRDGQGVLSL